MDFEKNPGKEKPEVLFHGTLESDLKELEPREKSWRDKDEGPRVFATPDIRLATIFAGKSERIIGSGKFNGIPYAIILGAREEFIQEDKGGYIYILPANGFECDTQKGLGENEWTSTTSVKPKDVLHIESVLDEMIKQGVQVYFVNKETAHAIQTAEDHGMSILQNLESENQRRGEGRKKFE
jgi:hypothetical protein